MMRTVLMHLIGERCLGEYWRDTTWSLLAVLAIASTVRVVSDDLDGRNVRTGGEFADSTSRLERAPLRAVNDGLAETEIPLGDDLASSST